jgi:hypothetical protein
MGPLDLRDIQTVKDINYLNLSKYEAEPMYPTGWTKLNTDRSIIGFVDEAMRVSGLSVNEKSRIYFMLGDESELYYCKLRLVREICKKCRIKAYKGHREAKDGAWNEMCEAWWPKGISPLRHEYINSPNAQHFSTTSCPSPVVNKWLHGRFLPKAYRCVVENNLRFTTKEFAIMQRGEKVYRVEENLRKVTQQFGYNTDEHTEALNKRWDIGGGMYLHMEVKEIQQAFACIKNPPIWCPHADKHYNKTKEGIYVRKT